MSLQAPRTSVFTFQSAVHSAHILQCLNEQRQRDVLCDVTVVVEDRGVRAHGSILASCSDYFRSRITNATRLNPVITLPEEVTMEGFEPLLNFAYTSKLLFTKENIHAIHCSADFLGFHNLEAACFDFLMPKFSQGHRSAQEARRRDCCQKMTPDAGLGPSVESNQSELPEPHSSVPSGGDVHLDSPTQCPHNAAAGPGNRRKENFCLENHGPQMPSLALTASDACPMLSLSCPDSNKDGSPSEFCEMLDEFSLEDCALPCELSSSHEEAVNPPHLHQGSDGGVVGQTVETPGAPESDCNQSPSCPIMIEPSGAHSGTKLLEPVPAGLQGAMSVDLSDAPLTDLSQEEGNEQRSSVEREVAEHLAKGFWPDLCPPSQTRPPPLDPVDDQSDIAKASDFHWQLDLSSGTGDCPFLRDLGAAAEEQTPPGGAGEEQTPPGADGLFQSESKSPYMSSSLNSAEDTDLDTDGDIEANKRRAEEVQLPFPVEQISTLSRNAFQQLLKDQNLTQDQLEFVHDVRRRSKNRVAAQRCRKRKLDIIHTLECEINALRGEKERLMHEHSHLKQNLEEARQSLSGLCRSVNGEFGDEQQQDQFQIFAKLSSPVVLPALSLLIPVSSSSSLLGKEQDSQTHVGTAMATACLSECGSSGPSVNSVQVGLPGSNNPETDERVPTQNCVPASILNACLDIDDNL